MKFVKLICCCLLLCFVGICTLPPIARASTKYVRVTQDGVKLYTNAETKKVTCLLEKSYYLVVLEEADQFVKVQLMGQGKDFPKIVGYVESSCVEMQEDEPTLPLYPTEYVTVQSSGARLYFLPLQSSDVQMVATNTQRLAYYGKIESDGSTWYYVYFSGCFGYVRQEDVTRVQINLHPTPLPQPELPQPTPPQAPSVETPTTPTTNPTNEIMLVAFAGILAAALTCALFLPKQKDKPNSFYHENR